MLTPRRLALLTAAALVFASSAGLARAEERLMPDDVRVLRLGDKAGKSAYKRALTFESGGAKMKLAAAVGTAGQRAAVVTAKKGGTENFASARLNRLFGIAWSAQITVHLLDVRTGGQCGLEASLLDTAGDPTSVTFAGVSPNPQTSGVTGFATKDGGDVGAPVEFPAGPVDILLTQGVSNFTIEMRQPGDPSWQQVYVESGTQMTGRQIGFGASGLERGNQVGFTGLEARGNVNGARERRDIRFLRGIRGSVREFRNIVGARTLDVRRARRSLRGARFGMGSALRGLPFGRDAGNFRNPKRVRDTIKLVGRARRQGGQALRMLDKLAGIDKSVAFKKSPAEKLRKIADKMMQGLALSTGGLRGWKTKKPKQLPLLFVDVDPE